MTVHSKLRTDNDQGLIYFGGFDKKSTKGGKTKDLYARICSYNTSHPFKDFKVYFLIEVPKVHLDEMEQRCLMCYDEVKARHSTEYEHRNDDNEWINGRPTREDIENRLKNMDITFAYRILTEEEIDVKMKEIKKREKIETEKKRITGEKFRHLIKEKRSMRTEWNERQYQTDIINKAIEQLALRGKFYIELATGAGKTYMFYRIAKHLSPKIIVAFSSRVNVNEQNVDNKYLTVLDRKYAVYDCSNSVDDYETFARENKYHIIVACINSCDKVFNMLRDKAELNEVCVWFDEAHYGVEKWVNDTSAAKQFLLKDERIANRIFTSASPDKQHVELYPDVFGQLYKAIKVSELIEMGWLCGITPYIFGSDTNSGNINDYNLEHFRDYGASFGFSFHNSRDNAFELFQHHYESYKSGATQIKPFFLVGYDYDQNASIDLDYDYKSVSVFKQQSNSIAYICDMYKMGFDFDKLDYLIFSDPKFSWQEIIQCIGRGTRSDKKGPGGTNLLKNLKLLLPVFVDDNETKYDNIVNVLQYLVYDADITPNSIEMDFRISLGTKKMSREHDKYNGDEDPKAVILDLVTRKQLKWKLDDFVTKLRKHHIHTREDYNLFQREYSHLSLPEHPGRIQLVDFTWEQTYQTSPYYSEEECREAIRKIIDNNVDLELDDIDEHGEYLHEQDNKIPPIDFKGFYGTDPPF